MDEHLGVISGMFQNLKHMLQGDTMIARLVSSIFHTRHGYRHFAQQNRHKTGKQARLTFTNIQTHIITTY